MGGEAGDVGHLNPTSDIFLPPVFWCLLQRQTVTGTVR